jgi:hypothetical protein
MDTPPARPALSEAACRRFAALALVDRLAVQPGAFHAALLEGDDAFLEPVFDGLLAEDLVAIGEDDRNRLTPLGWRAYQRLLHQQQSYLAHFDVFAAVDLAEGSFADPEHDYLDDPRWADLRVAVAEHKGIDPYRMVFLSMLAGGRFFENPGWKFDLALGSSFFEELQEVVQSQIGVDELGYEDEDGTAIAGEDVLQDVILQGGALNQQALAEERGRQPSLLQGLEGETGADADPNALEEDPAFQAALVPYDPWGPASAYASSATFVEPIWLDPYW